MKLLKKYFGVLLTIIVFFIAFLLDRILPLWGPLAICLAYLAIGPWIRWRIIKHGYKPDYRKRIPYFIGWLNDVGQQVSTEASPEQVLAVLEVFKQREDKTAEERQMAELMYSNLAKHMAAATAEKENSSRI